MWLSVTFSLDVSAFRGIAALQQGHRSVTRLTSSGFQLTSNSLEQTGSPSGSEIKKKKTTSKQVKYKLDWDIMKSSGDKE